MSSICVCVAGWSVGVLVAAPSPLASTVAPPHSTRQSPSRLLRPGGAVYLKVGGGAGARRSFSPPGPHRLRGAYEGLRGPDMLTSGSSATESPQWALPIGVTRPAELSQAELVPEDRAGRGDLFPEGRLDQDLQQVDLRERNSWRLTLAEVSSVELLETQLVNAVAPFVLNARLKPLMLKSPERDKHIVNVSAVEGQFYRRFKTTRHPHTNMALALIHISEPTRPY